MAEQKVDAIKLLLMNPYRQVLEEEYKKICEVHRYRKKIEGIENEVSWFNGKSNRYWTDDRQGFLTHYRNNYAGRKSAPMGPVFHSLTTFSYGEEPEIVYFMVLLVKKDGEMRAFMKAHPDPNEIRRDETLRTTQMRLRNEYRLLEALLKNLEPAVATIEASIAELFSQDLDKDADKLPLSVLNSRFLRSLRGTDREVPAKLLALLKERGAEDIVYLEALAASHAEEYEKCIGLIDQVPANHENHDALVILRETCLAKLGRVQEFLDGFSAVNPAELDNLHLMYILQELITHSDYGELDTDEFTEAMHRLVRTKVKRTENSPFTGMVSRNYVNYLREAFSIAAKLNMIRNKSGDSAMPQEDLERLFQLQMALDLYPSEDIASFVDLDSLAENGVKSSQEKIGKFALSLLLEKNRGASFENVYLALSTLRDMRLDSTFVGIVESNLDPLLKYGKNGEKRAYDLIFDAHQLKAQLGMDVSVLEDAMRAGGLQV